MGVAVEYSLEAGPPQCHQMSKSWRTFTCTTYNSYPQRPALDFHVKTSPL